MPRWLQIAISLVLFAAAIGMLSWALPSAVQAATVRLSGITTTRLADACAHEVGGTDGFCAGYIIGTFDALSFAQAICPPEQVSSQQVLAMGRMYLQQHPETWHLHPTFVVGRMLKNAFSCER